MMSKFEYDPEALANQLDQVIPPDSDHILTDAEADITPALAAALQLATSPKFTLSDDALARIQAKVDAVPIKPGIYRFPSYLIGIAAAVLLFLVGVVGLVALQNSQSDGGADVADLSTLTPTTEVGTMVISPTITALVIIPNDTIVPPTLVENTATPTFTEVVEVASDTPSPEPTSTPVEIAIVLEGPIDDIEDNTLFVYGFQIPLEVDDPLLEVLRIDDYIRVEGTLSRRDDKLTIIITVLELDNQDSDDNELYFNPDNGDDVWRDNGDCSNPPPPWAPAHGWRQRCAGGGSNNGNNQGNGNDNDD